MRRVPISVPGNGNIAPDLRRSDHAPFWYTGLQALFFKATANFRNSNYHTPNDNIATLDLEFIENVVKATLATLAELAIPISSDFAEADLSTALSISEHNHPLTPEISIFPNTSNGLLSLHVEAAKTGFRSRVEVYELTGKQVYLEILTFASRY
jgi:hypothetical protein